MHPAVQGQGVRCAAKAIEQATFLESVCTLVDGKHGGRASDTAHHYRLRMASPWTWPQTFAGTAPPRRAAKSQRIYRSHVQSREIHRNRDG